MTKVVRGYWFLAWIGLLANVGVLPCIGLVAFNNPDLPLVNFILAISLAWPAAIVGIVASVCISVYHCISLTVCFVLSLQGLLKKPG